MTAKAINGSRKLKVTLGVAGTIVLVGAGVMFYGVSNEQLGLYFDLLKWTGTFSTGAFVAGNSVEHLAAALKAKKAEPKK